MDRDPRRTDANGNFKPPRKATIVKPVEKKKFVIGAQGTYELEDLPLASGNYAEVFKARDTTTDVVRACKVINLRRRSFSDEERDNINKEIEILSLMQHENIIAYVDRFLTADRIYIVTELAPGTTLVEYYRDNNNYVTERDSRLIFRQICSAVEYLHSHGIIHRDIKSENIMIDENLKIMMIDFGLARRATGPEILTSLCGTLSYMAPEIDAGEESNGYTFHVDIWSIGVVLFRMLVGQYPFDDDLYEDCDKKETETNPKADHGSKIDFTRNWRPFVDKQAKRSPEVKYLLETILEIDPSRRARIDQILSSDWMRINDEVLANFDKIEHSGSTHILKSNEASNSSDSSGQVRQASWGELTMTAGGFRDSPRRIELKDSSYVLGRTDATGKVDVLLGLDRAISSKQCIIERDDSGVVMITNSSPNGTYVNNLRLGKMRSSQLFNGDVLGLAICPIHKVAPSDTTLGCHHCLKYNVIFYGTEKATPEQLAHRIYRDDSNSGSKKRQPEDEAVDEMKPAWGRLLALNGTTWNEELLSEKTVIGRDPECDITINSLFISRQHCIIEWVAEERKAYLTLLSTRHHTSVNESSFGGRLQLRHNDRIQLVYYDTDKETIIVGYRLIVLDRDTMPSMKRVKSAPVDIPVEVLQFTRTTTSPAAEETSVGQESTLELKREEEEDDDDDDEDDDNDEKEEDDEKEEGDGKEEEGEKEEVEEGKKKQDEEQETG